MSISDMSDFVGVEEARITRLIRGLAEGDPVAWGIVVVVVILGVISAIMKSR